MSDLKKLENNVEVAPTPTPEAPLEKLQEADKALLDNTKLKCELARANVKLAVAQSEIAELQYNNCVLQMAVKYKLEIGSVIEEAGTIRRVK